MISRPRSSRARRRKRNDSTTSLPSSDRSSRPLLLGGPGVARAMSATIDRREEEGEASRAPRPPAARAARSCEHADELRDDRQVRGEHPAHDRLERREDRARPPSGRRACSPAASCRTARWPTVMSRSSTRYGMSALRAGQKNSDAVSMQQHDEVDDPQRVRARPARAPGTARTRSQRSSPCGGRTGRRARR